MDHLAKIAIGVVFGTMGTIIFFYLIFDKLLKAFRSSSSSGSSSKPLYIPLIRSTNRAQHGQQEDMDRLIYEEYRTELHEILTISLTNETRCIGICVFLNELKIEYFIEEFRKCCLANGDLATRAVFAGIGHWSSLWTGAEKVAVLCGDKQVVTLADSEGSKERTMVEKFELKFGFDRIRFHWTENYVCTDHHFEELWEELVILARNLLKQGDLEDVWDEFPLSHWERSRVSLTKDKLHLVPHAGQVTDSDSENDSEVVTDELISL